MCGTKMMTRIQSVLGEKSDFPMVFRATISSTKTVCTSHLVVLAFTPFFNWPPPQIYGKSLTSSGELSNFTPKSYH